MVEIGESRAEHLLMPRIAGAGELLQHAAARKLRPSSCLLVPILAEVSLGEAGVAREEASAFCASADLVSHPRATQKVYLNGGIYGVIEIGSGQVQIGRQPAGVLVVD